MSTEIERKFLLEGAPLGIDLGTGVHLRQGYLAEDAGVSVRVRLRPDRAELTVKAGSGLSRTEVEVVIPSDQAEQLWPLTEGRRIDKTRHRVRIGGHTAEVDAFHDALDGLWLAEVEFDDLGAAGAFDPPSWFGREVTGVAGWTNAAMARAGRPADAT